MQSPLRAFVAAGTFAIFTAMTVGVSASPQQAEKEGPFAEDVIASLEWRDIGPARGGRATTCTGVPGQPLVYYMGATGGGVWKTIDAGRSWQPIADETLRTGSVGAVAVSGSDPNVVYVGMGERDPRGNFSHGDGMYKSEDAGRNWEHIGLDDTRQIAKVRIHPTNPELVYVAALGHIYGPNEERGIYRSTDGGDSWEKILYVDEHTGAIDLAMDPTNPRILYAGFWQVHRTPWSLESGGPGSGVYKSTDGGDTWEELTEGLPEGIKGKIGLSVSPVNPDRVFAIVEARDGGVFRSDNGGESWRRVNSDAKLRQRAWYYTHIYADTQDVDTVYVLNVGFWKSTDGGQDFDQSIRVPHGDNHDLWINPDDHNIMVNANDGGANVSFDAGASWSDQNMQATAQFYHVTVDNQYPYRVYGAQQDNSTISVSSRGSGRGGWERDAYSVGGGESGYIAVHPEDSDIVYAGSYDGFLTMYDHESGVSRNITIWPDNPMGAGVETMKYRFQWTFPIIISPHDPETVYVGANVLFKTTDRGQSWEVISPDLTTDDTSKQKSSGGPITKDNTSVEYYCTIFTIAPSPHDAGVIWVGSDDGLVHLTRDGGETWNEVTPAGLGEWSLISLIECSPHEPGTAYLAVNRYKMDDFKPYIFRTVDYGKTWKKITHGIADDAFVRAVREDTERPGLLYAGTETGLWVSFNHGETWQPLQNNLPVVPITDLVVKEDDIVVATQGRSFWILDNISPLRQVSEESLAADAHLFAPSDAVRTRGEAVQVDFLVAEEVVEDKTVAIALEFLDSEGELIKRYRRKAAPAKPQASTESDDAQEDDAAPEGEEVEDAADDQEEAAEEDEGEGEEAEEGDDEDAEAGEADEDADDPRIANLRLDEGMNRFQWNMRYPDATDIPGAVMWGGSTRGPVAAPGTYTVRLTVGEHSQEHTFEILPDPRLDTTREQYQAQFDFVWKVRNAVDDAHTAVNEIRRIRSEMQSVVNRTKDLHPGHEALKDAAQKIDKRLTEIEEAIIQTKSKSSQDPLNFPIRLNDKIAGLSGVASGNFQPTDAVQEVFEYLNAQLQEQLAALDDVLSTDIPAFNVLVKLQNVPAVILEQDDDADDE